MAHIDYLASLFDLQGKTVADVGAGDGTFSRQLCEKGAKVTGIEIDASKVARAQDNLPAGTAVVEGRAENLPLENGSQDLICFFFSFHHVPMDVQDKALAEVKRVLKPGGRLHVVEPLPEGTMFDVVKLVEDETVVRTNSHAVMAGLADRGEFSLLAKEKYTLTRTIPDFETFVKRVVEVDPDRANKLPAVRDEMEQTYNRVCLRGELYQPCIAYHFAMETV